jgi:hypothetical protein
MHGGAYRIPRVLDCQQSLLIVSKARQERLCNGHATVTRRAKIAGSQIGSALAPHWLSLILNAWECSVQQ